MAQSRLSGEFHFALADYRASLPDVDGNSASDSQIFAVRKAAER